MKRSFLLVSMLMLGLVLWGCSGNDAASTHTDQTSGNDDGAKEIIIQIPETPDGVLTAFLEAYQKGAGDEVRQLSLGGDQLVQEVDELIGLLYYDEASSEKIREGMRGFSFEIEEILEETDEEAVIQLKIDSNQVDRGVEDDLRALLREETPDLEIQKNAFEEWLPFGESYQVYLIKVEDHWQVDLKNEENKPLINTLAGHFPEESKKMLTQKLASVSVSGETLPPELPNNEVILKDGNTRRTYNVDPAQRADGLAVPYYGPMLIYGSYTSWDEETQTLTVIQDSQVLTIPFQTVPIGSREVTWADLAQATSETLEPVN